MTWSLCNIASNIIGNTCWSKNVQLNGIRSDGCACQFKNIKTWYFMAKYLNLIGVVLCGIFGNRDQKIAMKRS